MIWAVVILNVSLSLVMVHGFCLPSSLAQPSDSPQSFFTVNAKRKWLLYVKKLTFILVAWANPTKTRMPHKALKEANVQV